MISAGQQILASDFVSTSAGAGDSGKVPKLNGSGKLDSSFFSVANLPRPAFQQFISTPQGATALGTSGTLQMSGSNSDGSVLILYDNNQTSLRRYALDTNTGIYEYTHGVDPTISLPAGDSGSLVVLGSYLYFFSNNGTNTTCSRFLLADLTGETTMTCPATGGRSWALGWTDGTYMYVAADNAGSATTTVYKWSVSGTTFSSVTTGTFANNQDMQYPTATFCDPLGNIYWIQSQNGWTTNYYVIKLNDAFGNSITKTTVLLGLNNLSGTASEVGSIGIYIDPTRIYVGYWFPVFNATAQITAWATIKPVTRP